MSYTNNFKHADDVITHLNGFVPSLSDPLLKIKYIGFVTVAAVTVYELAIKDIFIKFAQKKHKVLGQFTENYFERINGRIKIKIIQDDYIEKFGGKYADKFRGKLDTEARLHLQVHRRDIRSNYSNLIIWRNDFAHEGRLTTNATYPDVVTAYQDGKLVIKCLAEAMVR